MAAGYIYVLVNSSMPGLVKVGKTSRLPSERVQELSSATGVATPFVIVFQEAFDNCDDAEAAVHAELERRGHREAKNREFFRAEPNEVIRVILSVASRNKPVSAQSNTASPLKISAKPWDDLLFEADALLNGYDNEIADPDEAIRVYKLAARMGSPEACIRLGTIYFYGFDVREDHREALAWFKEGAERGGFDAYIGMAKIFCRQERFDNALKAFRKFFEQRSLWLEKNPFDEDAHDYDIESYVHLCLDHKLPIEFSKEIHKARDEILSRVVPRLMDQISASEREELTRVRNTLLATKEDGRNQRL